MGELSRRFQQRCTQADHHRRAAQRVVITVACDGTMQISLCKLGNTQYLFYCGRCMFSVASYSPLKRNSRLVTRIPTYNVWHNVAVATYCRMPSSSAVSSCAFLVQGPPGVRTSLPLLQLTELDYNAPIPSTSTHV